MQNFNLGSLGDWYPVANKATLAFYLPVSGHRHVDFDVLANGHVDVVASNAHGDMWLVGFGAGQLSCKFAIDEPVGVSIIGEDGVSIFIKTRAKTQVLNESGEASFTNLEPRTMSESERTTRMQRIMFENQTRRMAALVADLERRASEVIEPNSAPAPALAPAVPDDAPA